MTSIRRFIIMISLAVITLVNFVAALQGYQTGLNNTEELFDDQLTEKAAMLAELSSGITHVGNIDASSQHFLYQMFDANGRILERSHTAPTTLLTDGAPGFSSVNHGGIRWRVYVSEPSSTGHQVLVAESTDIRYLLADDIIIKTIVPIFIGLPALLLLVWFVVTRGLSPLKHLAREVLHKKPQDLTAIQLQETVPLEIKPLLTAMNDMLARLAESFEKEKRFSGDAAHELRTPLSALKVNLYNLKTRFPEGDPDMLAMEGSIERMTHLIEHMLLLYRLSPEQFRSGFTAVDLYELARNIIAENYPTIAKKDQEISLEGSCAELTGNAFALGTMVKNLLDNANKYTPPQGQIRVSVSAQAHEVNLVVEDNGPGIPEELMERVVERFYRAHGDRNTSNVQGCGLGLSIVGHIVDLHHGRMKLMRASSFDSGLRVEISLAKKQESNVEE